MGVIQRATFLRLFCVAMVLLSNGPALPIYPSLRTPSLEKISGFQEAALIAPVLNVVRSFSPAVTAEIWEKAMVNWHFSERSVAGVGSAHRMSMLGSVPMDGGHSVSTKESPASKPAHPHWGWTVVSAATLLSSLSLLWLPNQTPLERKLAKERQYQEKLFDEGALPRAIWVGNRYLRVEPAWKGDPQHIADVILATEHRNLKNLSDADKFYLRSRVMAGQDINDKNLVVHANADYVEYLRIRLNRNPWSMAVYDDQGKAVGIVMLGLSAASSEHGHPDTWEKMSAQHLLDMDLPPNSGVDMWFTGDTPDVREAMIDLSVLVKELFSLRLFAYSNPRGIHRYPHLGIADYLLKVAEHALDKNAPGVISDPAISFHLRRGARIVRIIENAFASVSYPGQPENLHVYQKATGGGFAVELEYGRDPFPQNIIESIKFLLRWAADHSIPLSLSPALRTAA